MRVLAFFASAFLAAVPCAGQTTLQQYLNLTPQQSAAIKELNDAYQTYASSVQAQTNQLTQGIQNLYATPTPDPSQLGPLYVGLEAIRRDMIAHLNTLQQQSLALLTPAQAAQIAVLSTALDLQPLVADAQCAFLVDGSPNIGNAFASFLLGDVPTAASVSFERPNLISPYVPTAPAASFCNTSIFPTSIRLSLSLSDAQTAAIYAASATYNDQYLRTQDKSPTYRYRSAIKPPHPIRTRPFSEPPTRNLPRLTSNWLPINPNSTRPRAPH